MQPTVLHIAIHKPRETTMHKFAISTAAITAFAALLATAPALADNNGGGPNARNGQCFSYSRGFDKDGSFGYWAACPQTASVAAAAPRQRRHAAR